jgi:Domain of unknown function (DUF4440)
MSGRPLLLLLAFVGCANPPQERAGTPSPALADTLLSLFDSMVTIHQAIPDTALLRRMHPAGDTIMFVEGPVVHRFTGDSLVRRVAAAHHGVSSMGPAIDDRYVQLMGGDHAILTGRERVRWTSGGQDHEWEGLLTLVAARGPGRWVIRGYRH